VHQFDYNANAPLDVNVVGVVKQGNISTYDITYISEGRTISAYLVVPGGKGPFAGVVFMHWLASAPDANRTEFLKEAVTLARAGTVSILPQGFFPWVEQPTDVAHDCSFAIQQTIALRRALDVVLSNKAVDPNRIAFVGHDFGAMYGSILAGVDHRFKAFALMTPTTRFSNWFIAFWLVTLNPLQRLQYADATASLDPITFIGQATPAPVLLQFAKHDIFLSLTEELNFQELVSSPHDIKAYDADHHLNDVARQDRIAWVSQHLGLS
jgi:dienelactone hydrolase